MSESSLNDSREAIVIISEKDKKIADLKRQLNDLKERNIGLENCVKNQDSAVRKIGSLVVSPRSTASSDTVSTQEIEDVIDDVYRKIKRMEDIDNELGSYKTGLRTGGRIALKGQLDFNEPTKYDKYGDRRRGHDKGRVGDECDVMARIGGKDKLSGRVKDAEDKIFASERAFRQIAKEKPINDKVLSVRLEQLREERDTLYDILKQYEPVIEQISDDEKKGRRNIGKSRLEIEGTLTLDDKIKNENEKKELMYHIDELRKCLEDIKGQKERKKQKHAEKGRPWNGFDELRGKKADFEATEPQRGESRRSNGIHEKVAEDKGNGQWGSRLPGDVMDANRGSNHGTPLGRGHDGLARHNGMNGIPTGLKGNGAKEGNQGYIGPRRSSLVAEKPGVLNESETSVGNHVTRVLSDRIKELENEDRKKIENISELEDKLEIEKEANHELAKSKEWLLQNMNELVEVSKPLRQNETWSSSMLSKNNDENEAVKYLKDCVKRIVEEKANLKMKADQSEEKYWKMRKEIELEQDMKKEMEEKLKGFKSKDSENCSKIENLKKEIEEIKGELKELEVEMKLEKEKAGNLESKLELCEVDLRNEKENSALFKSMIQENEKARLSFDNEIRKMASENERVGAKCLVLNEELEEGINARKELLEKARESEQKIQELDLENDHVLKELNDLRHNLRRTQEDLAEAEKLRPLLVDAEQENDILRRKELRLEKEALEAKEKLREASRGEEELKKELESRSRELDVTTRENENVKGSLGSLVNEMDATKAKLDDNETELKNTQMKLNLRNEEVIENRKEISKEREKVNKLKEEAKGKNETVRKLQRDIREAQNENLKLDAGLKRSENEKESLQEKVKDRNEAVRILEMELKSLRMSSETLESEKKDLLGRVNEEEEAVRKLRNSAEMLKHENQRLKTSLKSEMENVLRREKQLLEAEKLLEDRSMIVDELANDVKKVEEANEELHRKINSENSEKKKVEEQRHEMENRLNLSINEFNGLQKSLEKSWKDKANIQEILGKCIEENKAAHEELKKLQKVVELKEEILMDLKHEKEGIEEKISKLDATNDFLKKDLKELDRKLKKKEEEGEKMEKKMHERDEKLAKYYEKNKSLFENIDRKNSEIEDFRNEIKIIKDKNTCKDSEIKALKLDMENLKSKHLVEMKEKEGKWKLFEEYNQSLTKQLDQLKEKENRMQNNGRMMKIEMNKLTDELSKAKVILKDFQGTLMDKDNDLKKINDAIMLLENAYATRQAGMQQQLKKIQDELETVTKENRSLANRLMVKESDTEKLKNENENLFERLRNEEDVVMHMQKESAKLEDNIQRIKRALVEGGKRLGRKEDEVNELRSRLVNDGREVEDLIDQLETTLRNVREQLMAVEYEKAEMREAMQDDAMKIEELEVLVNEMRQELQQKEEDIMLVKAKRNDLQKRLEDRSKETEDRKMIEELKTELFKIGREKQFAVVKLTKERDDALLQKTSEKLAKDNMRLQLKNMKEEIENLKQRKDEKRNENDKYVDELRRTLTESREREKEAVSKEGECKLKLKEMSGTVRVLENRITDAVSQVEDERKRREEILAQLLKPIEAVEKEINNRVGIDEDKWRKRASNLQSNIKDLKDQFFRYKNKNNAEGEALKARIDSTRNEEIAKLKLALAESNREKTAAQQRFHELRSELSSLDNKRQKTSQENNRLAEELRLARQEGLIQKHELDWLRNAVGKYGTTSWK